MDLRITGRKRLYQIWFLYIRGLSGNSEKEKGTFKFRPLSRGWDKRTICNVVGL